jgi:hypothetical protein
MKQINNKIAKEKIQVVYKIKTIKLKIYPQIQILIEQTIIKFTINLVIKIKSIIQFNKIKLNNNKTI